MLGILQWDCMGAFVEEMIVWQFGLAGPQTVRSCLSGACSRGGARVRHGLAKVLSRLSRQTNL